MLNNSKVIQCSFPGRHTGRLHEYKSKKIAELDGTIIHNPIEETVYICEGHYPDKEDPLFSLCQCGLCLKAKRGH